MYIGSITSRDSNHLPRDIHYDVLTTKLKKWSGVVNKVEKLYMKSGVIIEGALNMLYFFLSSVLQIQMFLT